MRLLLQSWKHFQLQSCVTLRLTNEPGAIWVQFGTMVVILNILLLKIKYVDEEIWKNSQKWFYSLKQWIKFACHLLESIQLNYPHNKKFRLFSNIKVLFNSIYTCKYQKSRKKFRKHFQTNTLIFSLKFSIIFSSSIKMFCTTLSTFEGERKPNIILWNMKYAWIMLCKLNDNFHDNFILHYGHKS